MPIYSSEKGGAVAMIPPSLLSKKPAKTVETFNQIENDADGMIVALDKGLNINGVTRRGAVALSHCQVSLTPFNFFVLDKRYKHMFGDRRIIVNPKIVDQSELISFQEGCLSFPDRPDAKTKRFRNIEVEYQYPTSSRELSYPKRFKFTDLAAIILQHEIDHGQGLNIHDKFEDLNKNE